MTLTVTGRKTEERQSKFSVNGSDNIQGRTLDHSGPCLPRNISQWLTKSTTYIVFLVFNSSLTHTMLVSLLHKGIHGIFFNACRILPTRSTWFKRGLTQNELAIVHKKSVRLHHIFSYQLVLNMLRLKFFSSYAFNIYKLQRVLGDFYHV